MSLACPACKAPLSIGAHQSAGKQLRCPTCRMKFTTAEAPTRRVQPPPLAQPAPSAPEAPAPLVTGKRIVLAVLLLVLVLPAVGLTWFVVTRARIEKPGRDVVQTPAPQTGESTDLPDVEKPSGSVDGDGSKGGVGDGPVRVGDLPILEITGKPVQFMGVTARGNRVCIIADASNSMRAFDRISRLKKEVKKTLTELAPEQEVYVIFFNATAVPQPTNSWTSGKDVAQLLPWVDGITLKLHTYPMPAFDRAFALDPRPDVIFFLTDGLMAARVPPAVAALNAKGQKKVPIHTILFGGESKANAKAQEKQKRAGTMLEQIAKDSGATFRFVPDR